MTTIREAILKAADHIERNPGEFDFWTATTPEHPGCGSPGCALGWIGHFLGRGAYSRKVAEMMAVPAAMRYHGLGTINPEAGFYNRMQDIHGSNDWRSSASACASALRLYADAYHPAAPITYPNWLAIASHQTIPESTVDECARGVA